MLRKSFPILILLSCFSVALHAQATAATEAAPPAQATSATQAAAAAKAAPPCEDVSAPLGPPSPDAAGMPGALGTCELKPADWQQGVRTFWKDSDGVAPGREGCHLGTNDKGVPNNRKFGEACRSDGTLIESNPKANELHPHANDLGHPDVFDCALWCRGTGRGANGSCQRVSPGPSPCAESARCSCTR